MKVTIKSTDELLRARNLEAMGRAQKFVDNEVLKRCDPYVPKDSGTLIDSGPIETEIGSGKVRYRTPYARRWYYEPAKFTDAPKRGNHWFTRMLGGGGRAAILRGVAGICGAKAKD